MEARLRRAALALVVVLSAGVVAPAANYRTQHFIVSAADPAVAKAIGDLAEVYRRDLAIDWLGHELPEWSGPCPIRADVAPHLGAGGATSFMFERGRPFGWQMSIQGSYERVLDSVLPHEITHTIFATHFGQPLPRWADEGACTIVEHESEKSKQHQNLIRFLQTDRGIAFNKMFAMREYPADVLPLYAQGYSLARFLVAQRGKQHFVAYIGEGLKTNRWPEATNKFYGYKDLSDLQVRWVNWVAQGSPPIQPEAQVASNDQPIVRGQNEPEDPATELLVPVAPPAEAVADRNGLRWRSRRQQRLGDGQQVQPVTTLVSPEASQEVTRPQPPQQVEQTILQWTRDGQPAAPVQPIGGASFYDRGSKWR
jgi:hypothetical protein